MMKYVFEKELQEAIIIKRNSQFTMNVDINGEIVKCHCPATTRIGDVDLAGVHCLVSKSDDPKRKLKQLNSLPNWSIPKEAS